jgi:hypothetical protein
MKNELKIKKRKLTNKEKKVIQTWFNRNELFYLAVII